VVLTNVRTAANAGAPQGAATKPEVAPSAKTPATEMTKAPEAKAAVKTVKAKKHAIKTHVTKKPVAVKHAKHRKHIKTVKVHKTVKHVRHAKNGGHDVKPVTAKPAPVTTGSAPKASAN